MPRKTASKAIEQKPRDIDGIPTAHGLVIMGQQYAVPSPDGRIRITDQGHRLLGQELRGAGQDFINEGKWHGVTGPHDGPPAQPGIPPRSHNAAGQG